MSLFLCILVASIAIPAATIYAPGVRLDGERLLEKFDDMRHQFLALQQDVQDQRKEIVKIREEFGRLLNKSQEEIVRKLFYDSNSIPSISQELQQAQHQVLSNLSRLQTTVTEIVDMQNSASYWFRSCAETPLKISGKYQIRIPGEAKPVVVYCEQDAFNGGWLVIQHRFDGSLSFDRNWKEYRNGFGKVGHEFWLGLERIHQLTTSRDCELLVELKDFKGNFKYARYNQFTIGSEAEQYKLNALGTYSGTADDALKYHKGMKFSTKDRDNDEVYGAEGLNFYAFMTANRPSEEGCANRFYGGWWFKNCYVTHLNGPLRNIKGKGVAKMEWFNFTNQWDGLSYSRMMIRELQ
ncbi:fibrinogen-like protein A [Anopheles aquasalis]|uniref:fibrinogen-like protein A n=1 Tax=Anopheles aquasalis TaxID=42839 RepID=UPI00215B249A|nr:fibrinogen-like protein A [Anopheles aquasalis]